MCKLVSQLDSRAANTAVAISLPCAGRPAAPQPHGPSQDPSGFCTALLSPIGALCKQASALESQPCDFAASAGSLCAARHGAAVQASHAAVADIDAALKNFLVLHC